MKNGSSPSESSGQPPVDEEHRDDRADGDGQVARDRAAVSVTTAWTPPTSLASRLWISPVRVSVKNRSGIALEVRVERAAQVLHHVLADDVVQVRLADADQARDDRDA